MASPAIVWSEMKAAKSTEFLTKEGVFPTSGDNRRTRCLDSWYEGELMKDAIGLRGFSGGHRVGGWIHSSSLVVYTGGPGWTLSGLR